MAKLFDVIELVTDISEIAKTGGRGTVVHCYPNELYEVEFPSADEELLNLLTLSADKFIIVWQAETHTSQATSVKTNFILQSKLAR